MSTETPTRLVHALVFEDPQQTLDAVTTLRARGVEVQDVHTPFAVHGMDEALGLRETRLPYATLVGGICGLGLALGFQIWTHTIDWPHNIGGKTDLAFPALVPVSFELTVLLASIATLVALLFAAKLRPFKRPKQPTPRVTDDQFVVLVVDPDGESAPRLRALWAALEPTEVIEGWEG